MVVTGERLIRNEEALLERGLVPALLPPSQVILDGTGLLKLGYAPPVFEPKRQIGDLLPFPLLRHLLDGRPVSLRRGPLVTQVAVGSWASHRDIWVDGEVKTHGIVWTYPWVHLTFWKHLRPYLTSIKPRDAAVEMTQSLQDYDMTRVMRRQKEILQEARDLSPRDKVIEVAEARFAMHAETLIAIGTTRWLGLKDKSMLRIP